MNCKNVAKSLLLVALATIVGLAHSADGSVIVAKCAASGPGVAACATVGVVLHEVLIAKEPFGPNGEGMKVVNAIASLSKGCGCATKADIEERRRERRMPK